MNKKELKKLVFLTGAGMSAESGLKTFRDSDGLWEEYRIDQVATPQAWAANPVLVLEFYRKRWEQICKAKPNKGHQIIAGLEKYFDVTVITQNIDNLHERAGSSKVLHLHGTIMHSRSSLYPELRYPIEKNYIAYGDFCERGAQLRPDIVWFGESVPAMEKAAGLASRADIFVVVGTSLAVYPAAGLVDYVPFDTPKFIIDPKLPYVSHLNNVTGIEEKAVEGLKILRSKLEREIIHE